MKRKLRFRDSLRLLVGGLAVLLVAVLIADAGQRRRRRQTPRTTTAAGATRIDYSRFSHATRKHQSACKTCHEIPTTNWQKTRDFPDVADFPGHDACVACHRAQFFKGAKPIICSDCHAKVSPRDDDRFAFRNPASPRQFLIEFPHDRHQDVIASMLTEPERSDRPQFVRASFRSSNAFADDKAKHYNNCEICHQPRTAAAAVPAPGFPDGFGPPADTFKLSPLSHASCFGCHWKAQEPVNENCGGCHKLADKAYSPIDVPRRISLKFRHGREQHVAECTTCHINITKSATLRGLRPDVPITACFECHNKGPVRFDVTNELIAIDKNPDFTCTYCHTSDIGRRDPPASHYLISGLPVKKSRTTK